LPSLVSLAGEPRLPVRHMLAGEPPFTGPSAQAILARHATDPVPPVATVPSTVPPGLDRALAKAMTKVPADRYGPHVPASYRTAAMIPSTTVLKISYQCTSASSRVKPLG